MLRLFAIPCFFLFLLSCSTQKRTTQSFVTDSLDQYISKGMNDWDIPGLAVVVVKDGKVVTMKGYGVKDIATKEPVDENTMFIIASNTKLFTGTALAQLEYNKKLSLDDKVIKYLPHFALYDPAITSMATIRDMLTHRIGTKTFQGDFTYWNSNLSRNTIISRMRTMKPVGEFRQNYGYCNSCYVAAGEVIPLVTGKPWEVYVFDSILMPLGMNNTHMLTVGLDERENVATPYTSRYTGSNTPVPYDRVDNMGAATSMVSNVNDLGKWLIMQIDSGRYNGKRILPWPALQATRDVNIMISSRRTANSTGNFTGYGLGVYVRDHHGRQVFNHGGGAFGFFTNVTFVPEERLGIAILTNKDNQSFFEALRLQLLDHYLGVPYTNHHQRLLSRKQLQEKEQKEITDWKTRARAAEPPATINELTGNYTHPTYGRMSITKANDKQLNLDFKSHSTLKGSLAYMGNNEWLLSFNHPGYGSFITGFSTLENKIAVSIKVTDFLEQDPYVFVKE